MKTCTNLCKIKQNYFLSQLTLHFLIAIGYSLFLIASRASFNNPFTSFELIFLF